MSADTKLGVHPDANQQASPPEANGNGPENERHKLFLKLAAAGKAIQAVEKQGHNTSQHYDFVQAQDVYAECRKALQDQSVLLFPSIVGESQVRETERVLKDTGQVVPGFPITKVKLLFRFVDADTGEALELAWEGEGADPADKGLNKAYTAALKTFLIAQFQIPTPGDDAEADSSTDEDAARGVARRSAPSGPAPADQRISDGKARRAFALKKAHSWTNDDFQRLLTAFAVPSVETLHWKNYDSFCEYLERKKPLPDVEQQTDVPADTDGMVTEFDALKPDVPFS